MSTPTEDTYADAWHWRAIYDDGTEIAEYDDDGRARSFLSVSPSKLKHLALLSQRAGLPHHLLTRTNPATQLYFSRRRQVTACIATGEELARAPVIHILGTERDGVGHYSLFFEDGSILVSDDLHVI